MKRFSCLSCLLLLACTAPVQSLWATAIKVDWYFGVGSYWANITGRDYDWTVQIYGLPDGNPNKGVVTFVMVDLVDQLRFQRLTLDTSVTPTGFTTTDGGALNNTGQWSGQPTGIPVSWSATAPDQGIAPFGQNLFTGTFRVLEPATPYMHIEVMLGGQGPGGYGENNERWRPELPSFAPDGGATAGLLACGILCLGAAACRLKRG
jgi:hypothetical protein